MYLFNLLRSKSPRVSLSFPLFPFFQPVDLLRRISIFCFLKSLAFLHPKSFLKSFPSFHTLALTLGDELIALKIRIKGKELR